jgi:hypothetical protein
MMRKILILAWVAVLLPAAHAEEATPVADSADSEETVVETIHADFDGDQKPDALELRIPKGWEGNGEFTRIVLRLSSQGPFTLDEPEGWVSFEHYLVGPVSDEQSAVLKQSPLASNRAALLKLSPDESALLLFGYPYVSDPGVLTVVLLKRGELPHVVFSDPLQLLRVADLDQDGRPELIGSPRFTQTTGADPSAPKAPVEVYAFRDGKLVPDPRLAQALQK